MLLNTSRQSNLLADACASRVGEDQLSGIVLDSNDLGAGRGRANVDHDDLVLGQLSNLGLLAVSGLDTKKTAQQVEVDLNLAVDLGQLALETENETDKTIGTAEGRVDASTNTDETTGDGVLEIVGLGVERYNTREDGSALNGALVIASNDTGADFDLIAKLDDTVQNRTTSNTALEVINLSTGLVDIEGSDDNHLRLHGEVSQRDGDGVNNGLVDGINVELELGGNGDYGRLSSDGTTDKLEDRLVVLLSSLLSHQIDLVLEDNDLVELHDLNGGQMLRGLGLGAGFVASNKEEGGIHDGGARQHSAHENIVTGAINEGDVTQQSVGAAAAVALAGGVNLLVALVAAVAGRTRALGVVAFVDLGVGVTELDGNVADQLVLEADSLDARNSFYDSRLAVSDVADGADVDGSLAGDNLGRERRQGRHVEILGVGLRGQGRLHAGLFADAITLLESRLEALLGDRLARVRVGLNVVVFAVAVGRHDRGGAIERCRARGQIRILNSLERNIAAGEGDDGVIK